MAESLQQIVEDSRIIQGEINQPVLRIAEEVDADLRSLLIEAEKTTTETFSELSYLESAENTNIGIEDEKLDLTPGDGQDIDSLQIFLKEARKAPLLTKQDETDLAKRIERGDLAAKDILIRSNLRWVINLAKTYRGRGLPFIDLIQEGSIGLIRAAEKYDYRKGFRFTTYATMWIKQSISRGIDNYGRTIRLPVNIGQDLSKIHKVKNELTAELGRDPTVHEIAIKTGKDVKEIEYLTQISRTPISFEQPMGEEGQDTLGEFIASDIDISDDASGIIMDQSVKEVISSALETLNERERLVIETRYYLNGNTNNKVTFKDIGEILGITSEAVRQAEARALSKMSRQRSLITLNQAIKNQTI